MLEREKCHLCKHPLNLKWDAISFGKEGSKCHPNCIEGRARRKRMRELLGVDKLDDEE